VADPRRRIGALGEEIAAAHLQRAGMTLLARNYRTRYGEVDLVVRDGDAVAFVEVKTRRARPGAPPPFGLPEEAVTARKRARILRAASAYLQEWCGPEQAWRVDVVSITLPPTGPAVVRHLPGVDVGEG
jgi:putative endonuclease